MLIPRSLIFVESFRIRVSPSIILITWDVVELEAGAVI